MNKIILMNALFLSLVSVKNCSISYFCFFKIIFLPQNIMKKKSKVEIKGKSLQVANDQKANPTLQQKNGNNFILYNMPLFQLVNPICKSIFILIPNTINLLSSYVFLSYIFCFFSCIKKI